nr:RecName: Full=Conotoxin Bu12; Flags: Precursor [Conus bullatus]
TAEDSRGTQLHRALRKATKLPVSTRCITPGTRCKVPSQCCRGPCKNGRCTPSPSEW